MKNTTKSIDGEIISFQTKRMGATVRRLPYKAGDGSVRWTKKFYFAKMVNGELARFPLPSLPAEANRIADLIAAFLEDPTNTIDDAKRKFNPRALLRPSNFSTIGELFEFHAEHEQVLEIGGTTAKSYRRCLLLILREVDAWHNGTKIENWSGHRFLDKAMAPWLGLSLTVVTAKLGLDYKRFMLPDDLEDEEEEITRKISCDTNLRSAHALFSREAMKLYQGSHTLALPDVSGFMGVGLFNAKKYFVLPDISAIRNIFTAAPRLKADDLNAYRAFLVCVQAGLRKSEAANFRLEWLKEEDSPAIQIHADGKFKPKHGHGRKVLLDPWVAEEIRSLAPATKYFLDGTDTERTANVFERLNAWLRTCGVEAVKPTHELRKLWFSQKVKRESLLAASQQGGHRDPKVTSSFYANSQMPDNVLPFWQEPTLAALAKTGLKIA